MGVQILNKDVSVISSVIVTPKASISSILGTIGWAGGVDVTPNPTPNWPDATADGIGISVFSAMVQITGITQDITISISFTPTTGGSTFQCSNGSSSAFFGSNTITNLTTSPTSITVAPNNYLGFYLFSDFSTTRTITITNVSDSNTVLDTFTLTTTYDE